MESPSNNPWSPYLERIALHKSGSDKSSTCDDDLLLKCLVDVSPWTARDDGIWGLRVGQREQWFEEGVRLFPKALKRLSALFGGALTQLQIAEMYWSLWLPISLRLRDQKCQCDQSTGGSARRGAYIQGVFGIQGTGKSTLSDASRMILSLLGVRAEVLSLDDIYLTLEERKSLRAKDARFSHRGPPGTHDILLGMQVIDDARSGRAGQPGCPPLALPRFDKSIASGQGDRVAPREVDVVDVLFFEGWFLGVPSVSEEAFIDAPPPILSEEDRAFAKDSNARLASYEPLWDRIDDLIALIPTDYSQGRAWRHRAEEVMRGAGRESMNVSETDRFIDYCWKAVHPAIFVDALIHRPRIPGIAVEISPNRKPGVVRRIDPSASF